MSVLSSVSARPARATSFLSRDQLLAGLFIVASANGLVSRVLINLPAEAGNGFDTRFFGISLIVWGGWACACYLILREATAANPRLWLDIHIAGILLLLVASPGPHLSWDRCLFYVGLRRLHHAPSCVQRKAADDFPHAHRAYVLGTFGIQRRGPVVLESRCAFLVGKIIGTEQIGNTVKFADGTQFSRSGRPALRFTTSRKPQSRG